LSFVHFQMHARTGSDLHAGQINKMCNVIQSYSQTQSNVTV